MKILIVSGFLGAGKTTFIKELIRRSGTRPVIMENEYGENNLDAQELERVIESPSPAPDGASSPASGRGQEMKILEFMEGCVCCTMKDSFVNSVLTIFSGLAPEYLVIEPTGVGRLSSILENLKPLLHDNIEILKPVVVLSPRTYAANMAEWPGLYRDQVANAAIVVFSKGEQEDPALLAEVAEQIREINPRAEIVQEHYSRQTEAWWRGLMNLPAEELALTEEGAAERFDQLSLHGAHLETPAQLILLLEDCLRGEMGHIPRAKGVLPVGGEWFRFDLADRQYALTGAPEGEIQCVFIGRDLREDALCRRLGTSREDEAFYNPRMRFG
ncbi:MAG: GTP-binding protein [Lachnospiraceae bacterium]|nr:GTP-binding protein [Lachnospiraceae bacterium]